MTFTFGVLSTVLGLVFAVSDVKSMWETSMGVIGLLGGAMCGLFLLGMFTRRANGTGAVIGAFFGITVVLCVKLFTPAHQLLYAGISIFVTIFIGYVASLLIPVRQKRLNGLTWYTINEK
jgi:Na+/proline symporter